MNEVHVQKHDVLTFLNALPSTAKILLKKDMLTSLTPEQIIEHINNKTNIGKEYFLQIAKNLDKRGINKHPKLDVIM
jgi:alpha-amylase/alpha-mannosidase (GH57 family)